MEKKKYTKPELKTRKIELGVFGDYGKVEANPGVHQSGLMPLGNPNDHGWHME